MPTVEPINYKAVIEIIRGWTPAEVLTQLH